MNQCNRSVVITLNCKVKVCNNEKDSFVFNLLKCLKLMFTGGLKPAAAFMTGKLKIHGDLKKAMKLEKLMGALKSKL